MTCARCKLASDLPEEKIATYTGQLESIWTMSVSG